MFLRFCLTERERDVMVYVFVNFLTFIYMETCQKTDEGQQAISTERLMALMQTEQFQDPEAYERKMAIAHQALTAKQQQELAELSVRHQQELTDLLSGASNEEVNIMATLNRFRLSLIKNLQLLQKKRTTDIWHEPLTCDNANLRQLLIVKDFNYYNSQDTPPQEILIAVREQVLRDAGIDAEQLKALIDNYNKNKAQSIELNKRQLRGNVDNVFDK